MCRVLLMNKQGENEIEKIYGLKEYLAYLEKQLGGHGNGYVLVKEGKIIKFEKGVNLNVKDIAQNIRNTNYDWCIFHTRFASMGTKCDKNCHPFIKDDIVLAMNGTERSVSFISEIREITDTEAILDTMIKYNLNLNALKHFRSIFMGLFKGKPFVIANNIMNIKILNNKKKEALVFASSFPAKFRNNIYEPLEEFTWNGEELPKNLIKCKKIKYPPINLNNYIYHNTELYEQCYFDVLEKGGNMNDLPI